MVKGLSRRVIVVDSPDPHIFEQAIFIVRNDAAVGSGGVTSQQVVDQAIRIAKDYARTHGAPPRRRLRMSPWLAALLGGAAIGAVIMSSISRLLVFIGLPSTYDNTITGIMLIVIVVVDALTQRRSIEMARRKRLLSRTAETAAEGECHQA